MLKSPGIPHATALSAPHQLAVETYLFSAWRSVYSQLLAIWLILGSHPILPAPQRRRASAYAASLDASSPCSPGRSSARLDLEKGGPSGGSLGKRVASGAADGQSPGATSSEEPTTCSADSAGTAKGTNHHNHHNLPQGLAPPPLTHDRLLGIRSVAAAISNSSLRKSQCSAANASPSPSGGPPAPHPDSGPAAEQLVSKPQDLLQEKLDGYKEAVAEVSAALAGGEDEGKLVLSGIIGKVRG